MVSLAANWDPAGRRECNDAHLHGGIELDDRPDLLRGWRRFDYGHRIPVGNTGSRMNTRRACAGRPRNPFSCATGRAAPRVRSGCLIRSNLASRKRPHSSILHIYRYTAWAFLWERFLALEVEGITWTGQSSRQGIAPFVVRIEFWRSTGQEGYTSRICPRQFLGP